MALFETCALTRREDYRLLSGAGAYVADGIPPGALSAVFVRSPHAHAKFSGIDAAAARTVPGCVGVFAHDDLDGVGAFPGGIGFTRPDGSPAPKTDRPLLADRRVRFVGEPVALVVAETRAAALEAAELVTIDYDTLPVVTDPDQALRAGAPAVWDEVPDNIGFLWKGGDAARTKEALAHSAHVTHLRYSVSRVTASPLEPRGAWAEVAADGRIVLHASTQSPYPFRNTLAQQIFHTKPDAVRVVAGDIGGSFGMKAGVDIEYALVAWAARKLDRPVRWIADRTEDFLADTQAREMHIEAELGLDTEARFTALRVTWHANIGAYVSSRAGWCVGNIGGVAGVYVIPAIYAESYGMITNTVPTAAYRGAGRPEATFTIERIVDAAAAELGMDPYELRRRNLIPPSMMPYKTALTFHYDAGEFEENMKLAGKLADLAGFPARREQSRKNGKLRGIGICNGIEVSGGPFLKPGRDMARVRITADGMLTVQAGVMSTGQGLETAFCQLVAGRFGVPLSAVRYEQGDTDQLPFGKGSGGSSALCIGGSALWIATDLLIEKVKNIAAEAMEAAAADLVIREGRVVIAGTDRAMDLAALAKIADEKDGKSAHDGIAALGEYAGGISYPNGTHICEVEIDPDTGTTDILRYAAVEELGAIVNPTLVHGQVHGGVTQGLGQAMEEKIVYDPESGQLLSASFMDYPMPHADEVPNFTLEERAVPTKTNPISVKGVGEAGTVGGLTAVINAVNNALLPLGIRNLDMPATPARVWEAINAASSRSTSHG